MGVKINALSVEKKRLTIKEIIKSSVWHTPAIRVTGC